MPPTANRQVMPSRGRLVKTKDAREFDTAVAIFQMRQHEKLKDVRKKLTSLFELNSQLTLFVSFYFVFEKKRLFTKSKKADSWVKTIDASNRLKSVQDGLTKAIGIDDKFHFQNYVEKIYCDSPSQEQVIIKIETSQARSWAMLEQEFTREDCR